MNLPQLDIEFGKVNLWLWLALFVLTVLYEWITVICTYAILKYKSIAVANISVGIGAIGMLCVVAYTEGVNNMVPILSATWAANYYAVEREKRKKEKESEKKKSL